MVFYIKNLTSKLFADDTTLYKVHNELDGLISFFKNDANALFEWGEFNNDINFSKTYVMFITN
jgi:hypothetical protein